MPNSARSERLAILPSVLWRIIECQLVRPDVEGMETLSLIGLQKFCRSGDEADNSSFRVADQPGTIRPSTSKALGYWRVGLPQGLPLERESTFV